MAFLCWLLLTFLLFIIQHTTPTTIELYKLSDEESKEIGSICGRIKKSVSPMPWAVRITVELDQTVDENGDLAISQCAGVLLSNWHILSVVHCFFNYKTENGTGRPDDNNKIFTLLSPRVPMVQIGWANDKKLEYVAKTAKVGACHYSFRTKGRKDIPLYYSYYNWALLQLEEDISKANDTSQWWKDKRIVPICVADPQTKPDPTELSIFGFGQHEQCIDGKPICIGNSNNTIVQCTQKNYYSTCISALPSSRDIPGAGWHWTMPKSGISALMAMTTIQDHSANILYGSRLKKRSFAEFIKEWINSDGTYDKLKPGATMLPLQCTTTVGKICSYDQLDAFKSWIVCFDGARARISVPVKFGGKDASNPDLFSVSLIVDTGSSVTWVWTEKTQFNLVINGTPNQVSSNIFYTDRLGPLPNYIPNDTDKHGSDYLFYSGAAVVEFDYYRNQKIEMPQQLGRVNMDMALVTNHTSPKVAQADTQGVLALGPLPRTKNPDNYFMGRFILQKPPNLEGIFSIDITIEDGIKKDTSQVGIGTSLRQLTSNAATLQVYGPIAQHKHWQLEVETLKITFPSKRSWIKNKIYGVLDTGTEKFNIPRKYFNEIVKTHRVDNASLYEQHTVMNCSDIYNYLPEIELDFRHFQSGRTNTIKIDRDKMFGRFLSLYTNTERCVIQFKVQNFDPDLFIFGVPVFAASYIEFNYETKIVSIDNKNLPVP